MAFNAKSFFAGVGTVLTALAIGFAGAYWSSSMLLGQGGAESNKLDRRNKAESTQSVSVPPSPSPALSRAAPQAPPTTPAQTEKANVEPASAAQARSVGTSRAELVPMQTRPERVRTEHRRMRAERKRAKSRPTIPPAQEDQPAQVTERLEPFSPFRFARD